MQRWAYGTSAVAAALLVGLTGCTGSSGDDGGDGSEQGDPSAASSAGAGKYRTLPEACGAVERGTLRVLLPGLDKLEGTTREKAYDGQPALTYDTDRRTGCRWATGLSDGTRNLVIDFERVVSYDPALSDDDRAQQLYDKKAAEAGIPAPVDEKPEDGKPSAAASESQAGNADPVETTGAADSGEGEDGEQGSGDKGGEGGTDTGGNGTSGENGEKGEKEEESEESPASSPSADPSTAPRALDGLGDVAYIDDHLGTADSGAHRDITIVFRASNVLVTITYDQWSTRRSDIPGSRELQARAQRLARELSDTFDA
ncbi:hypothetical protein DMH02_001595 [Streptomyces sp. WAC 00631]|uniref:hypothetical protein n=1 Tax=Streptomyces sp. WAC 00631 TaxID=2203201 RepID=UPI000F7737DD|nr:hypothetical protein [Streptomyces sp. WAC 00631]MCC5031991.1 hypothetical protein [Streptomyces sp. WAC 00631]